MTETVIKAKELSKKIGISISSLMPVLGRNTFSKYVVANGCKWAYKYNKPFLKDLHAFFKEKSTAYRGRYSILYYKVAYNIEQLIKKF